MSSTTSIIIITFSWLFITAVAFTNLKAAVLVPGFLTGADEFRDLCDCLTESGLPTVAVPMPNWHWIPCLGGRSGRPILERLDFTVKHLLAAEGDVTKVPEFGYNLLDLWQDFQVNPGGIAEVGGSAVVDDYPMVEPRGDFKPPKEIPTDTKIGLIGHSAGGWLCRAYLSDREYGGKAYGGSKYVHSLVTLGTPQLDAPGPAFEGIRWVNRDTALVRSLAVGGSGFSGDEWGSFTEGSYSFCSSDGGSGADMNGDGVTPLVSSLAFEGAEFLELPGVHHFPWSDVFGGSAVSPELTEDHRNGGPWYGSEEVIDKWASFLKDA